MKKMTALLLFAALLGLAACGEALPAATTTATTSVVETGGTLFDDTTSTSATTTAVTTTETTTSTTTTTITATAAPSVAAVVATEPPKTTAKPTTKTTTTTKKKTTASNTPQVPKNMIGGSKSGPLSWAEYQQALDVARPIADRYRGLDRTAQLEGIYRELRGMFEAGMEYSTERAHYADPYGYFVLHCASCAGSARATGMCLELLGIPWEHTNPGKYTHQWARVPVGNEYWICDPYGMYVGPEPAAYKHPYIET